MSGSRTNIMKRTVDAAMTILLLCLMAYQVTGEAAHEWIGMSMTALVIVHQILNRKWYGSLLKGKYNAYRILSTPSCSGSTHIRLSQKSRRLP